MKSCRNWFAADNIPELLSDQELLRYFKEGDSTAKEVISIHNIELVYCVATTFTTTNYEIKELVEVGIMGLLKSINHFELTRGVQFQTYASRCIKNEILMFLRANKQYKKDNISLDLDKEIEDIYGSGSLIFKLEELIPDERIDIALNYEKKERNQMIRQIVESLPDREKYVVKKYFGFNNEQPNTQQEIADVLGVTQRYVSTIIKKALSKIERQLKIQKVIEIPTSMTSSKKIRTRKRSNSR